jgi:hypothetical protein
VAWLGFNSLLSQKKKSISKQFKHAITKSIPATQKRKETFEAGSSKTSLLQDYTASYPEEQ